jgi:elongation factor Ts
MAITAQDVNKLRQMTGAGMMDCKKALTEANGDMEAAVDILRKAGQKIASKRADNATSEGIVLTQVNADGTTGKVVALACETEPVSKVEDFKNLAKAVLDAAVSSNAATKEDLLATAQADGRSLQDHITDLMGKIGEKIDVVSYETVTADQVVAYNHSNGKLGVLVGLKNVNGTDVQEVGKDVAMQIAAMKPIALIVGVIGKAIEEGLSERKVDKEDADRKQADEAGIAEKVAAE